MVLAEVIKRKDSKWLAGTGPAADVALSTRVRLARNVEGLEFPPRLDEGEATELLATVEGALAEVKKTLPKADFHRLRGVSDLERHALVEKHLISLRLAERGDQAALILSLDEAVSVMVNEEDHLRIQCLMSGLQPEQAWELATAVDDALERQLKFEFHRHYGYLTTCPTNTGTGMRASVMMHLPGLAMSNQAGPLATALSKVGIAVRGLYGEGTESLGNIFQISNQVTLGQTEREILNNLQGVCRQIIDRERSAREQLMEQRRDALEDRVWRAHGILTSARSISSHEAMSLLSALRLGIDLRMVTQVEPRVFNELLVQISPAYLQVIAGEELTPDDRDIRRAAVIRQRLQESENSRGKGGKK